MPVTIEPINPFLQSNVADIEILGSVDDPYVKYSFFESLTWPPYAPHVLQPTPKVKLGWIFMPHDLPFNLHLHGTS